jgi:hypothetical protein
MSCKGICVRYRAPNNYANGQKRCQICQQFITWNGFVCPRLYEKMRTKKQYMN